jgi:hypothetical protein
VLRAGAAGERAAAEGTAARAAARLSFVHVKAT